MNILNINIITPIYNIKHTLKRPSKVYNYTIINNPRTIVKKHDFLKEKQIKIENKQAIPFYIHNPY